MNITKCKTTIGAVALNLLLAFFAFGQTSNATDIRPLLVNKTIEREIKASEEHVYTVELKEGAVLRLELEEGIDVNYVFRLVRASDGETISESDLTTTFGRESITYIASAKESLKVLVKAPEKMNDSAKYKLSASVSKKASALDIERIRAEELSKEADKLSKDALKLPQSNRAETYQKSAKLAEEALTLRVKQADKYWEGWTLNFLGNQYRELGDKQKAIDYYNQAVQVIKSYNKTAANRILSKAEASTLRNIADIFRLDLKDYQKARDYYNQSLFIYRSIEDKSEEAKTLQLVGSSYVDAADKQKKLEHYNQSLSLYRSMRIKSRKLADRQKFDKMKLLWKSNLSNFTV